MQQAHFVCKGSCKAEDASENICQSPDCAKSGKALTECHCIDGSHTLNLGSPEADVAAQEVVD